MADLDTLDDFLTVPTMTPEQRLDAFVALEEGDFDALHELMDDDD